MPWAGHSSESDWAARTRRDLEVARATVQSARRWGLCDVADPDDEYTYQIPSNPRAYMVEV